MMILIVCLVGIVVIAAVIVYALSEKAYVKAGAQIGSGSFFIEASDKALYPHDGSADAALKTTIR